MSYMEMTVYNIYSFLFIIVYFVYIIIYLLILYVGIGLGKGNNSYRLMVHVKSKCSGVPYLTQKKKRSFLLLKYATINTTNKKGLFYINI